MSYYRVGAVVKGRETGAILRIVSMTGNWRFNGVALSQDKHKIVKPGEEFFNLNLKNFEVIEDYDKSTETIYGVGDKVWDIRYGWGEITNIVMTDRMPIKTDFGNGIRPSYTLEGASSNNAKATLYFEELDVPSTVFKRPKWRAEMHEPYYYVGSRGDINRTLDGRITFDYDVHKIGNYFKTEKDAMESKIYKVFHD
ncbi:MAG: hypothetical protein ACRCX7_11420 [Cetobacterium sp.]|uniref:hypothetical protein n=1 Tax=Cetobacterium sp. TaxID=2071632 RepID=UPI003F345568